MARRTLLQWMAAGALLPMTGFAAGMVASYRPVQWGCRLNSFAEQPFQVIREFEVKGQKKVLAVNTTTLQTTLQNFDDAIPTHNYNGLDSPYGKCLQLASAPPYPLENSGIRHANHEVDGVFLTVDLCPSHNPMEQRLFDGLLQSTLPRPIPINLAISGHWLKHHQKDVAWLLERERSGDFSIIWMNHTYNHYYDRSVRSQENFLLRPGSQVDDEILQLEWALLKAGLVPGVFFRFPGLVANQTLVERVAQLGLITIGSDAWLAKRNAFKKGSILLVHGNGNEPWGVDLLLKHIKNWRGTMKLLPLYEVFV